MEENTAELAPIKDEITIVINEMLERLETLPQGAMLSPLTHYDLQSLLWILSSILRAS